MDVQETGPNGRVNVRAAREGGAGMMSGRADGGGVCCPGEGVSAMGFCCTVESEISLTFKCSCHVDNWIYCSGAGERRSDQNQT